MLSRKRGFRAMVLGLLAAAGLALAPAAFAHGSWSVGINVPGVSVGYGPYYGYYGYGYPAYYTYAPAPAYYYDYYPYYGGAYYSYYPRHRYYGHHYYRDGYRHDRYYYH